MVNRKILHLAGKFSLLALLLVAAIPTVHLVQAAITDRDSLPPVASGHVEDASRRDAVPVRGVWPVPADRAEAERQLRALLARARQENFPVSIAGARHSMGGHIAASDGVVIDMRPLRDMSLSADGSVLTVGAGALWTDVIPFLDRHARSVAIMQSDRSFSVGGSLSVNVHGWQVKRPPIAASVSSLRIMLADGRVVNCSRDQDPELFSLALGGYGLFGVILEAQLWTAPNESYAVERHAVPVDGFPELFHRQVDGDDTAVMAYGRLRVTREAFLEDATLTVYRRVPTPAGGIPPMVDSNLDPLKRLVFRGTVGSEFGKSLRWTLESLVGEKMDEGPVSRNQLLNGDVSLYVNRVAGQTDILHEYFVPMDRLPAFIRSLREIIPRHGADLLNVTLRDVRQDNDTFLRYADRDYVAVVMFFEQENTDAGEAAMAGLTRQLIDAALQQGGRYYLPYRPHATRDQFAAAYPRAAEFPALKRKYDPDLLFRNDFYNRYLRQPDAPREVLLRPVGTGVSRPAG